MEHFTPSEAPIHETQRLPIVPPPRIIGRNRELGQTFAQMRVGAAVLLHGPSGVGKSALAATIATAFTTFKGGVLWWTVNGASLEELVVATGRAYGERALTDHARPLELLDEAAALLSREHKPLVVLDGQLDLDVAREFIRRVAPGVPLIFTAEEAGTGPWTPLAIGALSDEDALALFVDAAGYNTITPLTRADIQGVCSALGGLPLALVLAARHVHAENITPGEFLGALPGGGSPVALAGLPTILHQLPEALQGFLLTLGATFAGQASTALLAAAQLAPEETVGRVMEMLGARGLVQRLQVDSTGVLYRIHAAVHAYLQAWLAQGDRVTQYQNRLRDALLAYAAQHGQDAREARASLLAEMPNLLGLAAQAAETDDGEALTRIAQALALAFAGGGFGYEIHWMRAHLATQGGTPVDSDSLQMPLFEGEVPPSAVQASPVAPVASAPVSTYDTSPFAPVEPAAEAVEPSVAETADPGSPFQASSPFATEEAEPEAEDIWAGMTPPSTAPDQEEPPEIMGEYLSGDPEDMPLEASAEEEEDAGDLDELLAAGEAALASGNKARAGAAYGALGHALLRHNRAEEAQEAYREALNLYEDLDDADGMLVMLEALAGLALDDGDLEQAVTYATRAENLAAEWGEPARHGHLLALLGDIRMELGEIGEAIDTYGAAIDMLEQAGDMLRLGVVQTKLGNAYLDQGSYPEAVDTLSRALKIFTAQGRVDFQGRVLGNLGTAYGRLGQWLEAENRHKQALAIAQQAGDLEEQERQLANLAYVAQGRGDRTALIASYRQALDLAYRSDEVVWQVRYLDALGRVLMDDVSRVALAVRLMEAADSLIPDDARLRWLRRAQTRLDRILASGIDQTPVPESLPAWAAAATR